MYKIIGNDQKIYGPVPAEQVRQWMAENRITSSTLIQAEGSTEWKPLSAYPEFAQPPGPTTPPPISVPPHFRPGPMPHEPNSMATAGFVLGVLSLIPCCCFPFIFAVLGIIFSIIGLNKAQQSPTQEGRTMAIVGLVCSILGLAGGLIFQLLFGLFSRGHEWNYRWHHNM